MASREDADGPTTVMGGGKILQQAQQELQSLIETYTELGVIIYDYPDEQFTRTAMIAKFKAISDGLKELEKSADQLASVEVPVDVLGYIDAGRNPDVYSREFVELSLKQNQLINGKLRAAHTFRDMLVEAISAEFPDIAENLERSKSLTDHGKF